ASQWPDFQVEAMYSKLLSRSHNLADVFGIGDAAASLEPRAGATVPLQTREDRVLAVRRYHLDVLDGGDIEAATDRLEQAMKDAGVVIDGSGRCEYEDPVLRSDHGAVETVSC